MIGWTQQSECATQSCEVTQGLNRATRLIMELFVNNDRVGEDPFQSVRFRKENSQVTGHTGQGD